MGSFHPITMTAYSFINLCICKASSQVSAHLNFQTPNNLLTRLKDEETGTQKGRVKELVHITQLLSGNNKKKTEVGVGLYLPRGLANAWSWEVMQKAPWDGGGGTVSWVSQDIPHLCLGSILLSPTKHVIWQEQPGM